MLAIKLLISVFSPGCVWADSQSCVMAFLALSVLYGVYFMDASEKCGVWIWVTNMQHNIYAFDADMAFDAHVPMFYIFRFSSLSINLVIFVVVPLIAV